MRDFETLYTIAADRKGGAQAFEKTLSSPKTMSEL